MRTATQQITFILVAMHVLPRHQKIIAADQDAFDGIGDVDEVTALKRGDTPKGRGFVALAYTAEHGQDVCDIDLHQTSYALTPTVDRWDANHHPQLPQDGGIHHLVQAAIPTDSQLHH